MSAARQRVDHWTELNVSILAACVAEGLSFSLAAARIGGGVTRNAALGKAARLRTAGHPAFQSPSAPTKTLRPAPQPRKPALPRPRVVSSYGVNRGLPLFCQATAYAAFAPEPKRVAIIDLRDRHCRFLGQDGSYCGHDAPLGQSWCPYHARLVYYTPKSRRAA